ncbi:MAG: hypothetical protein ACJAUG_002713 [Halioglobus sp.]
MLLFDNLLADIDQASVFNARGTGRFAAATIQAPIEMKTGLVRGLPLFE